MIKVKLILLTLIFSAYSYAQKEFGELTFNKAVNISGKQRMLGQKMSKAYLYLLEDPTNKSAKKELKISKIIFEKHHEILIKNSTSKKTSDKLDKVTEVWDDLKIIFDSTPNLTDGNKIVNTNSILLKNSDDVVKSIIVDAGSNSKLLSDTPSNENISLKKTIDISGRQRMLSQRLALYYYANMNYLKGKEVKKKLHETYDLFDTTINNLLLSDFNNKKIDVVLGKAMRNWEELKKMKRQLLHHKIDVKEIYTKTNDLTQSFNELTALYEKVKLN